MSNRSFEKEIQQSALPDISLDKNHDVVRNVLKQTIERGNTAAQKKRIGRAVFSMGVTVGFTLGIALVWMLQDKPSQTIAPPQPQAVATNLGSLWCTYSDNQTGGTSVVWPPESNDGQNNFVKSAPGYGEKGYAVRFKGQAGEQSRAGFIGVSTVLGPPCPTAGCSGVNIQQYEKVRFKMKGQMTGGELMLRISNVENDSANNGTKKQPDVAYEAKITDKISDDWQTVTLDLRDDFVFAHAGSSQKSAPKRADDILADAKNLKWHVRDGKGAKVDVWIDELEFY